MLSIYFNAFKYNFKNMEERTCCELLHTTYGGGLCLQTHYQKGIRLFMVLK